MGFVAICGMAVACVLCAACIKTWKPELATVLRLAFCVLFGTLTVQALRPLTAQLTAWLEGTAADYSAILLRAIGVAWLTHLTAELCRDCGESTLAGGVETLGKLEILALSLPLVETLLGTVKEILRW